MVFQRILPMLFMLLTATAAIAQEIITDDLNRAALGSNWKVVIGGQSVGIVDEKAIGLLAGPARFGLVQWNHSGIPADQFSERVIAADRNDSVLTQVFVRRRESDAARYGFHWDDRNGGEWQIKYDGVPTPQTRILARKQGGAPTSGDRLRIEVRGRSIRGLLNGEELLTAVDDAPDAITEAGRPGMAFRFTIDVVAAYPATAFDVWSGGKAPEAGDPGDSGVAVAILVDNTRPHQVFEGFGATTLPLVYGRNDVVPPVLRAQAIEAAYGEVGLTMGDLTPGLWETPADATDLWSERRNDNDDPITINPDGFNRLGQDAMKWKVVDPASAYGFDNYALSNKIQTRGALSFLESIRVDNYERFLDECAEFIVAGMIHWRDEYGIVPRWVTPWNEPTSGNREIASGSTQLLVDLVRRIGKRLEDEGFGRGILVVPGEETVERSYDVAKAILEDADARPYVGAISYHAYPYNSFYSSAQAILTSSGRGQPNAGQIELRTRLRDLGREHGVPVWLNEISEGPGNANYAFEDFRNLRARAIHIHDEMVYADASVYFGMLAMWDRKSHEDHFAGRNVNFFTATTDIVLIDTNRIYISGMGYAIGHYARWLKRGAVRIEAPSSDWLVQVTAFRDDASNRLVMVLNNNATASRSVQITLKGLKVAGIVRGEQSTDEARWQGLPEWAPIDASTIGIDLPKESVTTIAATLASTPASMDRLETTVPQMLGTPFPNPARGAVTVEFMLPSVATVRCLLIDALGREVALLLDEDAPAGVLRRRLQLDGVASGTYLLSTTIGGLVVLHPVTVLR